MADGQDDQGAARRRSTAELADVLLGAVDHEEGRTQQRARERAQTRLAAALERLDAAGFAPEAPDQEIDAEDLDLVAVAVEEGDGTYRIELSVNCDPEPSDALDQATLHLRLSPALHAVTRFDAFGCASLAGVPALPWKLRLLGRPRTSTRGTALTLPHLARPTAAQAAGGADRQIFLPDDELALAVSALPGGAGYEVEATSTGPARPPRVLVLRFTTVSGDESVHLLPIVELADRVTAIAHLPDLDPYAPWQAEPLPAVADLAGTDSAVVAASVARSTGLRTLQAWETLAEAADPATRNAVREALGGSAT
ncbi:hypothetical protein [Streptomyces collinus]|uniref:hypothetical protein n=1 Tax=Streptomyces collinus TaxID=42684 RepID=UPI003819AF7C